MPGTRCCRTRPSVLTHCETATSRNTTSDPSGTFRITALPPGVYDLRLTRPGFSALQLEITLVLGEDRRVDLTMTIGPVDTTVTVGAGEPTRRPLRDRARPSDHRARDEYLPIQGRLFLNLALLTPGILNSYNTTASGSGFAAADKPAVITRCSSTAWPSTTRTRRPRGAVSRWTLSASSSSHQTPPPPSMDRLRELSSTC